jgi:hypothetical protein
MSAQPRPTVNRFLSLLLASPHLNYLGGGKHFSWLPLPSQFHWLGVSLLRAHNESSESPLSSPRSTALGKAPAASPLERNGADSGAETPEPKLAILIAVNPATLGDDTASLLTEVTKGTLLTASRSACLRPSNTDLALAVTLDGALATLVYLTTTERRQRVDLYRYIPPSFVRSVVLDHP